ncbi:MAG: hypothetical protein AABZ12_02870 [Planctomycetota bacterium]
MPCSSHVYSPDWLRGRQGPKDGRKVEVERRAVRLVVDVNSKASGARVASPVREATGRNDEVKESESVE